MRQNLALLYVMKGDLASAEKYVRRDMPPEVAEQNMTYYRQLRDGMAGGAVPAKAEGPAAKSEADGSEKPEARSSNVELASIKPQGYRLQLGSFKSLDGAEALRLKLLKKHGDLLRSVDLVVETVTVPERGDSFQVNSRPVPDREMVDETCLKLAIRDVPCLLIRAP